MSIEDKFPESFKRVAYHPSAFVWAFKRKDLEKLFEELNLSNVAIKSMEVWLVDEILDEDSGELKEEAKVLIPMKGGQINHFLHKNIQEKSEEWPDFVDRSIKETTDFINSSNLEKTAAPDRINRLWYHFEFLE